LEHAQAARAAFADESALWEAYAPRIYRYLARLTGEPQTAEDLTQETFLQAIRDLRRAPAPPANPSAWLFRIATNRATDLFRRRRLISWLPFTNVSERSCDHDTAEALAQQDLVNQVLTQLPPDTAALLLLKDGEGFSTREIAELLGQNYESVRKRMARAREQFRTEYVRLKGE
jgi:RNA polymerase sigma-70 factor, ECF subfamily